MAVTEVYKDIYQIDIPLPNSPLKSLNCYIVLGDTMNYGRHLLIDNGFNNDESYSAMLSAFVDFGIVKQDVDMFITHLHADHCGMTSRLKTGENAVYASPYDSRVMKEAHTGKYWESLETDSIKMGFPEDEILKVSDHPGYTQNNDTEVEFRVVVPGDTICAAGYTFEVIDLSGHTPGQIGLYEREHKLLFCGDHILNKITPNITYWSDDFDALGVYMNNLRKVKELEIEHLFTAHRHPVEDPYKRIDQLLAHHDNRLKLCMDMLEKKERTVYEIALGLNWDFAGGDFKKFPVTQKWFAAGEAYAHVEHLYKIGRIKKRLNGDYYVYSL